jgi:hypothetical protein
MLFKFVSAMSRYLLATAPAAGHALSPSRRTANCKYVSGSPSAGMRVAVSVQMPAFTTTS